MEGISRPGLAGDALSLRRRVAVRVEGTVQGVGFRPFVYRLACDLGLGGFVLNDEQGVLIEVEGDPDRVNRFLEDLTHKPPPLATIDRVYRTDLPPDGISTFAIAASTSTGAPKALVSPDTATCGECLSELFNPEDRRYRYPFINCTNCGPRLTIVRGIPYDRPFTTMAEFAMCDPCRTEYEDPRNRRFHAQPNACKTCGPSVRLLDREGFEVDTSGFRDVMEACADALGRGLIVAAKGLGGYHLACRADDEAVVGALRARKHREDKPFALMVGDETVAGELIEAGVEELALLASIARPIVLAPRRLDAPVAEAVAPGAPELGVMLAYSPLHHILLTDFGAPVVMTSANVSDEPIAFRDDDAKARLSGIADLFLVHNRPIHTRVDDSVVRAVASAGKRKPLALRRSRGYVPASVALPIPASRPVLACGAELKNTFCLAKGQRAWIGHHIGDLKTYETLSSFQEGIEHFKSLFSVEPGVVAHDMHPDYLSTTYAFSLSGVNQVAVQHHHAHLASCLAEHGHTGACVGAVFDGTGYGLDGSVWGGELLCGGLEAFERVGHLWGVRMPGGEQAVRQPWRMACSWMVAAVGSDTAMPKPLAEWVDARAWKSMVELIASGIGSPITTSVGRLFDAVAVLCGLGRTVNYEGQAAVELEAIAARDEFGLYELPVLAHDLGRTANGAVLDARETVRALLEDLRRGSDASTAAARFHNTLATATAEALANAASSNGVDTAVLSGGVFQNRLLLERTASLCARRGLRVLIPSLVPCNDGGISFGQAAVACQRTSEVS